MKKITIIILIALFILTTCLVGCSYMQEQLATPENVRIEGDILTWDSVNHAKFYLIYLDEEEQTVQPTETSVNLLDLNGVPDTTYQVSVVASSDTSKYLNSEPSVAVPYIAKENPNYSIGTLVEGVSLEINNLYNHSNDLVETLIDTQNHNRYTQEINQYVTNSGESKGLNLNIPLQDFFTHSVYSINDLTTSDGKTYNTNSGFKVAYDFSLETISEQTKLRFNDMMNACYEGCDKELIKVVDKHTANSEFYNEIYEVVNFENSYIDISKKTDNGYESIKKISSATDWKSLFTENKIEILNDNGALFFEPGKYRVLFKYDMGWFSNPYSAVYEASDTQKVNPIYPFGQVNEQYESFYITVSEGIKNVLMPNNLQNYTNGFFCQMRADVQESEFMFIPEDSTLKFSENIVLKIGAEVDMMNTKFLYQNKEIKSFELDVAIYKSSQNTYEYYKTYDLFASITEQLVYGEEITVDLGKDVKLRDEKCKFTITYSVFDKTQNKEIEEEYNFFYTLWW